MTAPKWDAAIVRALNESNWWQRRIAPSLIEGNDGCVEWHGHMARKYGQVAIPRQFARTASGANAHALVHRVSYLRVHGDMLKDLVLDHLCRNTICTNVTHLEPKTIRANLLADGSLSAPAANVLKVACGRCGAPYTKDNLVAYDLAKGERRCLACNRAKARAYAAFIRDAHMAMGMQQREYAREFGLRKEVAMRIVEMVDAGMSPDDVRAFLS